MFHLKYEDLNELGALANYSLTLDPAPTEVVYPERRKINVLKSQEGNIVTQRSTLLDDRPRTWRWRRYPASYVKFSDLWKTLSGLDASTRWEKELPRTVHIWEDVSGVGGFDRLDVNGVRIYTGIQIMQVNAIPRLGGGPVIYENATVEFYIDDSTYDYF